MNNSTKDYIFENKKRFFEELFSLIRIPSVSSHLHRQPEIQECAKKWCEILLESGVDKAEIMATDGNPVVFATKFIDSSYPTIMVYGHYDVMPAEPLELWTSAPFKPEI
ncbi:MAG TPA: peptidase M20, partial [Paludibacter sp.]